MVPKVLPELLQKGLIKPNRFRLLDQGKLLDRTEEAIDLFRQQKISGEKLIIGIQDK